MLIRKKSHTFPSQTVIKEIPPHGYTLKLLVVEQFSKNKCCEIDLFSVKCECKTQLSTQFHRKHFPAGPHSSHKTLAKDTKRLRKVGYINLDFTTKIGRPEDVSAYVLIHPNSSTREISEICALSESRVWNIQNEMRDHPY